MKQAAARLNTVSTPESGKARRKPPLPDPENLLQTACRSATVTASSGDADRIHASARGAAPASGVNSVNVTRTPDFCEEDSNKQGRVVRRC